MKLWLKLPFTRTEKVSDKEESTISRRHWEEIARTINWNADRNLLVGTDAEMTAMALHPENLREDQVWYNKTDGLLYRWDGTAWVQP